MDYFDYEKIALEADLSTDHLAQICQHVRSEFPQDEMLYELHVLRICMSLRDGWVSLADLLQEISPSKPVGV
jgi:hypothetical protein